MLRYLLPLLVLLLVLANGFNKPQLVEAIPSQYQQCIQGNTCTIGEFLFDDNHAPQAAASCSITTRNPAGTLILNATPLTEATDAWYYYEFDSTGADLGLHRSQICCTVSGDTICIDKSFEITSPTNVADYSQQITQALLDATASAFTNPGSIGEAISLATSSASPADIWNYSNRSLTAFGTLITDIWSSPTRSLTTFGTLIADIWNYTNRSLTSFGTLVADIWSNPTRTVTNDFSNLAEKSDLTNLATKSDLDDINLTLDNTNAATSDDIASLTSLISTNQTSTTNLINTQTTTLSSTITAQSREEIQALGGLIAQNRTLLVALLEKPILTDANASPFNSADIKALLNSKRQQAQQLFANHQQAQSRLGLLVANFDALSATELTDEIRSLLNDLGTNPDSTDYATSLLALSQQFHNQWPTTATSTTLSSLNRASESLAQALSQVDVNLKTAEVKDFLSIANQALATSETAIGNVASGASSNTIFGQLKDLDTTSTGLQQLAQQLSNLLSNFSDYNTTELSSQLDGITQALLPLNLIGDYEQLLNHPHPDPTTSLLNQAIGLTALIELNQRLILSPNNAPVHTHFITFQADNTFTIHTASFNPATLATNHQAQLTLPTEVSEEDIISLEGEVSKAYDEANQAWTLTSSHSLSPRSLAVTKSVIANIFTIDPTSLASVKEQAELLTDSLSSTSFYPRATTLLTEITGLIGQITARQSTPTSPQEQIARYRQSLLDFNDLTDRLAQLQDLALQADTSNTLMGFMGGIQAVSVWGIVIIIIAGVVFLTLYMRMLHRQEMAAHPSIPMPEISGVSPTVGRSISHIHTDATPLPDDPHQPVPLTTNSKRRAHTSKAHTQLFHTLVIGLTTASFASMAVGSLLTQFKNEQANSITQSTPNPTPVSPLSVADPAKQGNTTANQTILGVNDQPFMLHVPEGQTFNLRSLPKSNSKIILELSATTPAKLNETSGEWVNLHITTDLGIVSGWLHQDLLNL